MRILHLSWEYPPVVYGGLGRHVHAMAEAQAALGHEVTVLTQSPSGAVMPAPPAPAEETVHGVRVVRVERDPPTLEFCEENLLGWVASLESAMTRRAMDAADPLGDAADAPVVHAHDWMVSHVATALRDAWSAPLVATLHATEAGRHQGWLPTSLSRAIHAVEGWLVHSADGVITCSVHMREEVSRLFNLPSSRIDVVPNGIDTRHWTPRRRDIAAARERYAPHGPLVVYCGRLEWEKGVHTLIDALPRLRRRHPALRAVIAGRGGAMGSLLEQARERRVTSYTEFPGWLPESELHALVGAADALVVPSIYEPFGMVALEGAALGAPLVVARSGGLSEVVVDGATGRTFAAGDVADLARAVGEALDDPPSSRAMAEAARRHVRRAHPWQALAEQAVTAYRAAAEGRRSRGPLSPALPASPPAGNLLRDVTDN